jgi:hypothetical protein
LVKTNPKETNPKHWQPFGCPVYVLDKNLLAGTGIFHKGTGIFHKWKQRVNFGIYLGRSPQHARSVALVLDQRTALLVSPQFHVSFDRSFNTMKQDEFNSQWQIKAGSVAQRELKAPTTLETVNANKRQSNVQWVLPPEGATPLLSKQQRTNYKDVVPKESNTETLQQNDSNQTKVSAEEIPAAPPAKEKEPIKHIIEAMMREI